MMNKNNVAAIAFVCAGLLFHASAQAQSPWMRLSQRPSTLGLENGNLDFKAGALHLKLVKASQTVAALQPDIVKDFDFTPGDSIRVRSSNGLYHLGDLNLRLRSGQDTSWKRYSTATHRAPVSALPASGNVLAAADLAATFPADIPLQVKRFWQLNNNTLVLRFELKNNTAQPVEIGALGIPMIFNNILDGKTLEQAHAQNVFYDPYIGMDAGYLQVTRLSGHAPSLVVAPYGKTPFEAYNPLMDDPTPRGIAFEGFYEWMVYSKAYADSAWKNVQPWNQPTSTILKPGETRSFGLQFIVSGTAKDIESKLAAHGRPVAVGVPGYVLPQDVNAKLFLNYKSKVKTLVATPQDALSFTAADHTKNGWQTYLIKGNTWGRARLTITYEDGLTQTINYKVIKPESSAIADYGHFLTHEQWFDQPDNTFHRSPAVISYDYEKKKKVTQDNRAWIAGLSDEGGAGGWLGATMKQLVEPNKEEVDKLQLFIDSTLWGHLQKSEGPEKYGVKKSLFYYEPDSLPPGTYSSTINFKTWSAWPKKEADDLGRSYNYPHVAAAHWVMYRLARNHQGLVITHDWRWYLTNAYETALAMVNLAPYYAQFGQMEGSVFYLILRDLKAEGLTEMADKLEAEMKKRALHWRTLEYPFGSEMPWDSTGQEEVYIWSYYFGYMDKADVTLNAILAYMPTIPHWAYNGNARRYWDFLYGGNLSRIERMIHHYGSALNAIPVLTEYRRKPADFYLLRVGYGGLMGAISNITEDGFAPCAFHSFPNTLRNDGLSGDYGSGFYGYAVNTVSYMVHHQEFGWLAFGGNLTQKDNWVSVQLTTAAKSSVYIAESGLWINLDAGSINTVSYNTLSGEVKLSLNAADAYTPVAFIKLEQPAQVAGIGKYAVQTGGAKEHGAYRIALKEAALTEVVLKEIK